MVSVFCILAAVVVTYAAFSYAAQWLGASERRLERFKGVCISRGCLVMFVSLILVATASAAAAQQPHFRLPFVLASFLLHSPPSRLPARSPAARSPLPPFTQTSIDIYRCQHLGAVGSFLVRDYRVKCYTPRHNHYRAVGVLALIFYPIGFPLMTTGLLLWYRVPSLVSRRVRQAWLDEARPRGICWRVLKRR